MERRWEGSGGIFEYVAAVGGAAILLDFYGLPEGRTLGSVLMIPLAIKYSIGAGRGLYYCCRCLGVGYKLMGRRRKLDEASRENRARAYEN